MEPRASTIEDSLNILNTQHPVGPSRCILNHPQSSSSVPVCISYMVFAGFCFTVASLDPKTGSVVQVFGFALECVPTKRRYVT